MPKKTKGELTREMIVDNAINFFSKYGYENTSIQEIADKCGISQTNIFYHFKSKKGLFSEIVEFVILQNRSLFLEKDHQDESPWEQLVSLLEANIDWATKYPNQAKVLLSLFHFAGSDKEMKKLVTKVIDNGRYLTKEYLIAIDCNMKSIDDKAILIQQWITAVIFQVVCRTDANEVKVAFKSQCKTILKQIVF